jgi:hypothetical protein
MAEMMGGILGAGAGLAGAALQAQAQQTANVINWMNLQFQKQNAAKQFRLSTAARGDAYGNKQSYDEILNEWKIALTPTQNKIIKAGEAEQLKSLTEDAARNRAIKVQQHARGLEAAKDYTKVLAQYRYGGPKSELAMRDELTNLLAGVEQEQTGKKKTEVIRAAMREGRGGDTATILKGFDDASGETMAARMLQAKQGAQSEFATRSQQHMASTLPLMQELTKLMDMGGDMPQRFSDVPQQLATLQQQQFAGIQGALGAEASQVGGAFGKLAESMGKSPDFSSIAKSLSGMGGGGRGGRQQGQQQQQYDQQPAYSVLQNSEGVPYDTDRWTSSYGDF